MYRALNLGLVAFVLGLVVSNDVAAAVDLQPKHFTTRADAEFLEAIQTLRASGLITDQELEKQFDIGEITVNESQTALSRRELTANGVNVELPPVNNAGLANTISGLNIEDLGDIKTWVTLGAKFWKLIEANVPVANVQTQTVSVLPAGLEWTDMESWQGPFAKSYTITAKNLYGMTVISQTYTVAYNYGGSVKGKGQFLANATIIPTAVEVMWGFKLGSELAVGTTLNTGTYENPVPGVDLTVQWKMDSILKHLEGRDQFFVRGDGSNKHVTLH